MEPRQTGPCAVALGLLASLAPASLAPASLAIGSPAPAQQTPPQGAAGAQIPMEVLQDWCITCHEGESAEAGLDLSGFAPEPITIEGLLLARQIRDRVRAGEMPPPDGDDPMDVDERERLWRGADAWVREHAPQQVVPAGRSTVRRLSRWELANTLRDLFGVSSREVSRLPADDLGYGFDNIGDAVTFSLLHLEKYQAVAADVASQVATALPWDHQDVIKVTGSDLDHPGTSANQRGDVLNMFSRGEGKLVVNLVRGGTYELRLGATGDQAGDEPPRAAIVVDGVATTSFDVTNSRNDVREFTTTFTLDAGRHTVAVGFTNDYYRKKPDGNEDRNLHVHWVELRGPSEPWTPPAGAAWLYQSAPANGSPKQRFAQPVRELLRRAWRRDPTAGERRRVLDLVAEADWPAAVQAVLLSPNFLFRVEAPPAGRGDTWLNDEALATRLSYFLWGSMPDDALRALAQKGWLGTPKELRAAAERMLGDSKAEALATHFAGQWLELRRLAEVQPDPDRFGVDRALLESMARETERLFLDVLRRDLPARTLLTADYTWTDEALRDHYGLAQADADRDADTSAAADGFAKSPLPPERQVGILAHGSVLTVTSNPTRTSPVKRGKWVLENILSASPPPPPPGVDSLEDEDGAIVTAASLREQMAAHRSNGDCAGCHRRMDAMGLALENFDAVGRWRERDEGGVIDAAGELPDGRTIDGVAALRDVLLETRSFERTLLHKLFVYGVGRAPTPADEIALEARLIGLPQAPSLRVLILEIISMDAFCKASPP